VVNDIYICIYILRALGGVDLIAVGPDFFDFSVWSPGVY